MVLGFYIYIYTYICIHMYIYIHVYIYIYIKDYKVGKDICHQHVTLYRKKKNFSNIRSLMPMKYPKLSG